MKPTTQKTGSPLSPVYALKTRKTYRKHLFLYSFKDLPPYTGDMGEAILGRLKSRRIL